nr:transposase [Streptomyces telluris]
MPLLPQGIKSDRPPVWTRRQLTDGIRWRTRTGSPWRDVPERYGPWDRPMTCSGAGSGTGRGPGPSLNSRRREMRKA